MPTQRSILLIVNPTSGRGRALRMARAVAQRLSARGLSAEIRAGRSSGDAEKIVRAAVLADDAHPDCVVACGGDGTVQEIANVLAPLKIDLGAACPALGLAPAGRCNDFARALGIKPDPSMIAETLADGDATPIDLGRANGRYFCTVAAVGIDADISSFVDTMRMPLRGMAAYLYGTLRVLCRYRGRELHIDGDFGLVDKSMFVASAANTSSYGGAIRIAPDAVPNDGFLDLCLIEQVSRPRMFTLLPKVVLGRHSDQPEVRFVKTKRLSINASQTCDVWADGERIGRTPAMLEVAPGAVDIILPRNTCSPQQNP